MKKYEILTGRLKELFTEDTDYAFYESYQKACNFFLTNGIQIPLIIGKKWCDFARIDDVDYCVFGEDVITSDSEYIMVKL